MSMIPQRTRDRIVDSWSVVVLLPLLVVPFLSGVPLLQSLTHQVVIGTIAGFGVYIMLRMDLLTFTVPAFMAVGGYTAAKLAVAGTTNLIVLTVASFIVPVLFAIPIGLLVLRLRGVYFIFFTFILNEVLQVVIFVTPKLTGGPNGIADIPSPTLFGLTFGTSGLVVLVTVLLGIVAALVTLAVTQRYRSEFSSIQENEPLTQSLGLAVWRYRSIGFLASAGVSGLGGFALVNMLTTAHPSSFSSFSAINYVAYAIVGGRGSMLGTVVGAALLILTSNYFSSEGVYSAALFGVLLIVVVMAAPEGIVGEIRRFLEGRRLNAIREQQ